MRFSLPSSPDTKCIIEITYPNNDFNRPGPAICHNCDWTQPRELIGYGNQRRHAAECLNEKDTLGAEGSKLRWCTVITDRGRISHTHGLFRPGDVRPNPRYQDVNSCEEHIQ